MDHIVVDGVEHTFHMGRIDVPVLFGVDLVVKKGEFLSLCGSSGSGKSTLLNLLGGLMKASKGEIFVNDHQIGGYTENELCYFRRENLGFIFQSYNLIPSMTAFENVELPLLFAGITGKERQERAEEMLIKVGLDDRMHHRPNEMSGGQQQRVAIARALVSRAPILLADEPTGNLDSKTGREIMNMMREFNLENNKTVVMVTHDLEQARISDRIVYMRDGTITDEEVLL
ncbi:MAG TPA: ABC transporter ATP-binding protein [Syntrophomonas sp.]|nr:ABC transporter ATP-binding protein [Syntrophomonas sp.]